MPTVPKQMGTLTVYMEVDQQFPVVHDHRLEENVMSDLRIQELSETLQERPTGYFRMAKTNPSSYH